MTTNFNDILQSRRSVRKYKENVHISASEIKEIINETMLAPSSFNMQPYKFLVVESKEEKEKINDYVQFNTLQLETSSAMVFVLGDYQCFDNFEQIYGTALKEGKLPQDVYERQAKQLSIYYKNVSKQDLKERILLDSGIISMNFMLVAKNHGYDTCPMGGFDKKNILDVLSIDSNRYFPVLMFSIGEAAEQGYPSIRMDAQNITIFK